jgi:hypothetical protein
VTAKTPAERAREHRDRLRGGPPRTLDDSPLARARRKMRRGARVADLDPAEQAALRAYHAEQARARRGGGA